MEECGSSEFDLPSHPVQVPPLLGRGGTARLRGRQAPRAWPPSLQGAFTENNDTMSPPRETPWKGIAIVLAILLGAVVIAAALIVGGIMQLGFSLL